MGFIYVCTDPYSARLYTGGCKWKVGFTTQKVDKRLSEFETSIPNIYVCFCYETSNPEIDEKRIHTHLEKLGFKREIKERTGNQSEWFFAENVDVLLRCIFELLYPPREKIVEVIKVIEGPEVIKIVETPVEVVKIVEVVKELSLSECAARLHSHFSSPVEVREVPKIADSSVVVELIPEDPLASEDGVFFEVPGERQWTISQRYEACFPSWSWCRTLGYHDGERQCSCKDKSCLIPIMTLKKLTALIQRAKDHDKYLDLSRSFRDYYRNGKFEIPMIQFDPTSSDDKLELEYFTIPEFRFYCITRNYILEQFLSLYVGNIISYLEQMDEYDFKPFRWSSTKGLLIQPTLATTDVNLYGILECESRWSGVQLKIGSVNVSYPGPRHNKYKVSLDYIPKSIINAIDSFYKSSLLLEYRYLPNHTIINAANYYKVTTNWLHPHPDVNMIHRKFCPGSSCPCRKI